MTLALFLLFVLLAPFSAVGQDIVGFPRSDFGKLVLSQKQFGATLEASVGAYNNEPISKYGPTSLFAELGRPIGRLDILTDRGVFPCTAFLISQKFALTNHHCVPGIINNSQVNAKKINAIQLVLGYVRDGVTDGVQRYSVSISPVEADEELDYAVLEVFGDPSRSFGSVKLASNRARDGSPLWIIGHPMGEAQRISREDCLSASPAIANKRLRHRCDTLPGNSGSPVIDPTLGAAVALHHAGSRHDSINFAVPMELIVQRSRIIAGLIGRSAVSPPRRSATGAAPVPVTSGFNGLWLITRNGPTCRKKNASFSLRIENRTIVNARIKGDVKADGTLQFSHPSSIGKPSPLVYSGKLSGTSGRGRFSKQGTRCAGTFTVEKQF